MQGLRTWVKEKESRRTPIFVAALAAAKLTVVAAVAASRPKRPYFSRITLMFVEMGTKELSNLETCPAVLVLEGSGVTHS